MTADLTSLGLGRKLFRADHDAFRESTRRFFQRSVEPNVHQWEIDGFFPAELFREAGRAGLLCAGIPTEYGGGGGDVLHHIILHEEHGYSVGGAALEAGLTTDLTANMIYDSGTEQQKQQWLPFFASGEGIAEVGVTESGAGSDARGIKTFARRDGDDYVINGQKSWMSNGPILTVLFVVTKIALADGRDGTAMFIVPMDTKGVTRAKPTELLMKSCGGASEVFFDDVRVPARYLLGEVEGLGLKQALNGITLGRVAAAVRAIAACELAMALTVDYTKGRNAFGQTIFDFQNTQFQLATAATGIAAGRAFVDSALAKLEQGTLGGVESAQLKLFCTELEGRVMDECLQLHGAAGYSNEYAISKMYAFARIHRIYIGTSEILRTIIGRSL
ncbi:MAG: Acyl-CoA dehydrogenase [Sphingomonadales bacterium]|nr:Acyl-CoA dehydrogenase [Sphingomonadales bacterium]